MARHAARFNVSEKLLAEALAMPEGTVIYNIKRDDYWGASFEFVVEHPDLPEVIEGAYPVAINPRITVNQENKPGIWLTFDWGIE